MSKLLSTAFGFFLVSLIVFAYIGKRNQDMAMFKLGQYFRADGEDIHEFIRNMREDNAKRNKVFTFDKSKYTPEAVAYFDQIAFFDVETGKREHDGVLYPYTEDVNIYIEDGQPTYIYDELQRVVRELNDIIDPIQVNIVTDKSEANMIVAIGSSQSVCDRYPIFQNRGSYSSIRGRFVRNSDNYANIMLNTDNIETIDAARHVLREEVTQALGLCNDSWMYPESIFYEGFSEVTEYAPIDRELISILYNK